MKKIHTITDENLINDLFEEVEFATLALCSNNKPYSLPINFVRVNDEVFFHGNKKGKKIELIKENSNASLSLVDSISFLPSYFSTADENASPATHMYKSIICDGNISFVEDFKEKTFALASLMEKYQKEGGYKALDDSMYEKIINATCIYKLNIEELSAKFYLGQNYNEKRFSRIIEQLKQRGSKKDLRTIFLLEEFRK